MMLSSQRLRLLRNDIPFAHVLELLLGLPVKHREGFLRFLCPQCGEMNTAVNPRTNLGRCFTCSVNFNTIDIVIAVRGCSFKEAVIALQALL
jgi:predicted RNA-binding Zn-ribbon protein involved in translation (DUF1610 family)